MHIRTSYILMIKIGKCDNDKLCAIKQNYKFA
jgi:hypothetical protein